MYGNTIFVQSSASESVSTNFVICYNFIHGVIAFYFYTSQLCVSSRFITNPQYIFIKCFVELQLKNIFAHLCPDCIMQHLYFWMLNSCSGPYTHSVGLIRLPLKLWQTFIWQTSASEVV